VTPRMVAAPSGMTLRMAQRTGKVVVPGVVALMVAHAHACMATTAHARAGLQCCVGRNNR
jgi:hypothetical protein